MSETTFNEGDVRAEYRRLKIHGGCEVRPIDPLGRVPPKSRFPKSEDEFVEDCREANANHEVYFGVNPRREGGTEGKDVVAVSTAFFDVDPVRPKLPHPTKPGKQIAQATTDEEKAYALEVAERIIAEEKFTDYQLCDSGNGYQIEASIPVVKITDENRVAFEDKIQAYNRQVVSKYTTDKAKIDMTNDLPRIKRVAGTMNKKLSVTPERPNRLAKIVRSVGDGSGDQSLLDRINAIEICKLPPEVNGVKAPQQVSVDLDVIISKDKDVAKLMAGDISGFASRSEAESSLAIRLRMRGLPRTQMDMALSQSKIGKWATESQNYRERTLDTAIAKAHEYLVEFYRKRKDGDKEAEDAAAQRPKVSESVYSYEDIMAYTPKDVIWLIENQIPVAEVGIMIGRRGEHKTWVAYEMAVCVASGKPMFGVDKVPEPKPVLIIDEESGLNEDAKRIQMIALGLGLDGQKLNIKVIPYSGVKWDMKARKNDIANERFEELKRIIYEFKPALIIVDCFQRIVSFNMDEDNYLISGFYTDVIRPIVTDIGCSFLFIHHVRKAQNGKQRYLLQLDDARGGSEATNYPRVGIIVQHQGKEEENRQLIRFTVEKLSNAPKPLEKAVSFNVDGNKVIFKYEGKPDDVFVSGMRCAVRLKEYIIQNNLTLFKTADLIEAKERIGYQDSQIAEGRKVLLTEGFILSVDKEVRETLPRHYQTIIQERGGRGWYILADAVGGKEVAEKYPDGIPRKQTNLGLGGGFDG